MTGPGGGTIKPEAGCGIHANFIIVNLRVCVAVIQCEDGCSSQSEAAAASDHIRQRFSFTPWFPGKETAERKNCTDL